MARTGFAVAVKPPWREIPCKETEPVNFIANVKGAKGRALVTFGLCAAVEDDAKYDVLEKKIESLSKTFTKYELIEKAGITRDGMLGFKITFYRDLTKAKHKCQSLMYVKGDKAFQIMSCARADEYDLYVAAIDQIINSFIIIPDKK